mmetsp:Transcript_30675/g.60202  ORF Transcript_30675/g.60202 Transcript_30675/m.60202 type:complete len:338 (-) Transcript_30675:44-1057(-)|eukprot:CAMPEP_0172737110 /NCGR_PEP_ID=MMETSP1074-20121228/116816_1 /TAXON_ID=2916 /ORGANISM="Ceratium fusus, Strain PA161109" /LENGTH=337 /DNA_ID=CAMNT_0013566439 /DNA_START=57 /DNA_END=1070 /DNA_ORIENTATION=+
MEESSESQKSRSGRDDKEESALVTQLRKEKADLQQRLEFVEELVGPTEAQRKTLQEKVLAAREAALKAKYHGASVPTKVAGRLDERLLWQSGLCERDAGLLQGGCLPDNDGILQDVSVLGDPNFRPYDQQTGELRWHARGGMLQLSLGDVRSRFGESVAHDVVRCAKELDEYDASRRVGVELPWHPLEDRELEPSEVIDLLDRELGLQAHLAVLSEREIAAMDALHDHFTSPYAVAVNAAPRRGRGRPSRQQRCPPQVASARGGLRMASALRSSAAAAGGTTGSASGAVVSLPRLEAARRGVPEAHCVLAGPLRNRRLQEPLGDPLLGCTTDRIGLY